MEGVNVSNKVIFILVLVSVAKWVRVSREVVKTSKVITGGK